MPPICLDASLVLLWFLREELSPSADALLDRWRGAGAEFIAPPMLAAEVPSVLRQAVYRGRITLQEGDEAFQAFLEMEIRIREPEGLLAQAWALGKTFNSPRLYDMYYLALADVEKCELWTADRRFADLAAPRFSLVRWIGDIPMETSDG